MRVPSYRKHSRGRARVTINGRDYMLGKFGSAESRRMYDRKISEWLASGRSSSFGVRSDQLTIAMLLAGYAKHAKDVYGGQKKSEFTNMLLVMRPIRRLYSDLPALEFGVRQWKAVRQYVSDGKNVKAGNERTSPSRSYVNAFMKRVNRIFRWAAGDGDMIPAAIPDSFEKIEPLKRGRTSLPESSGVTTVPDSLVEATLPHLHPIIADMVRFQRLTGCRPGEVCKLTKGMIDRVTFKDEGVWVIDMAEHKTAHHGKTRLIPIGEKAQSILTPYMFRSDDQPLFSPKEAEAKRRKKLHDQRVTPLSCGNRPGKSNREVITDRRIGNQYTTLSYGKAISRACAKAFPVPEGLSESDAAKWKKSHSWAANQLRHNALTAIRHSDGLEAAAAIGGHSNITTTQIYAERDFKLAIKSARKHG